MVRSRLKSIITVLALLCLSFCEVADAQNLKMDLSFGKNTVSEEVLAKSPAQAFLRSLALPGWGHFYAGNDHRNRGYIHAGTDIALLGTIFGFNIKANRIENDYITFVNLNAGVDLSSRNRSFRLAVGDFNSLNEYNDYQLRSRNWNRLIEDTPQNRWLWESTSQRFRYRELRSQADNIRNQLPAIAGLMVVNRIISGISAYNRVRKDQETLKMNLTLLPVSSSTYYSQYSDISGVKAQFRLFFN